MSGFIRRFPSGALGLLLVALVASASVLAPWLAPFDPLALDLGARLLPPGAAHLFGTDQAGRDLLSRIIWGGRESLLIAFGAVLVGCAVGLTLGLVAGY